MKLIPEETVKKVHDIIFKNKDYLFKANHIEDVEFLLNKACGELLQEFREELGRECNYYSNLDEVMQQYCDECGRGEEDVIEYIKQHDSDPSGLYKEVINLQKYDAANFIGIILASDYNIFVPWYKKALIYYAERDKGKTGVSHRARDILNYYKADFNKVAEL